MSKPLFKSHRIKQTSLWHLGSKQYLKFFTTTETSHFTRPWWDYLDCVQFSISSLEEKNAANQKTFSREEEGEKWPHPHGS